MAEYQRFVAYVYGYQKGKKENNCGFIRVEAREKRCRLELHLTCPGLTPDAECRVYGFVRNGGLLDGYLLGNCRTETGRAECVLEADAENMGGSGLPLGRLGGLILKTEHGAFFGTEWDDQPIRPGNFREMAVEKQTEEIVEPLVEVPQKECNREVGGESEKKVSEETSEEISEEINQEIKEELTEEPGPEPSEAEQQSELEAQAVPGMIAEPIPEPIPEEIPPSRPHVPMPGEPFEAFSDGDIIDTRKIQLQDLNRLPCKNCNLRNNRFLQYGFYNFGHLLLGRKANGQYILGVPGGYDQQERFMANMFGFPFFKESGQIELPKGRGGYWYRLINV